jgi:hypothetical protein
MIKLLKPRIAVYDCPDAIIFQNSNRKQRFYDELKKKVLKESTISFFQSSRGSEKTSRDYPGRSRNF